MLRTPPNGDPFLSEWARQINAALFRREPELLGYRFDGTTLFLRFRAPYDVPWVQVHVQSTAAGEGGGTAYDPDNYTSSDEVDCRSNPVQDVEVTDVYGTRFYVWLVPVQYDGAGTKVLYDGQDGRPDNMSFFDLMGG